MEIWSESDVWGWLENARAHLAELERDLHQPTALTADDCRQIAAHWATVWGDTLRDDTTHRRRFRGLVSLAGTRGNLGFLQADTTEHLASMLGARLHEEIAPGTLRNNLAQWSRRHLLRSHRAPRHGSPITLVEFPSLTNVLLYFATLRAMPVENARPYAERLMPLIRVVIERNVEPPAISHWQEIEGERRRIEQKPTVDAHSVPITPNRRRPNASQTAPDPATLPPA